MVSVPRRLLTLLLLLLMLPGWGEALENLEHLVHDGHLAHETLHDNKHEGDTASAGHEALAAEHGCTPMSHSCGCHVSVPVVLPDEPRLGQRRASTETVPPLALACAPPLRTDAPPRPPPTA